ncbi:hypothetical protein [Lactiplantibacillus fabifermentans]|uniref:Uncharacterized protein n=2 Tax=Lactiplantibacillus fabifermentans TaxID=483011 RepID=A0A0R2NM24_9LACO|nr:hypothetical protein [Lactiplantibacillus fabifermentans]ETY75554.1 hypothetical protein LFAB_01240 [Lactiplantibacillus fabifermentans T30PCM01]KRO26396.1 hypothetical protein DY78_GL000999 [Lactiplantibacillus fabifermentans DSM 21115]
MEVAVQVALVRHGFGRAYATGIFEDCRVGSSFKVRFETAFWLEPVATATGIAADPQRQLLHTLIKQFDLNDVS